jgi:hypothetical protein
MPKIPPMTPAERRSITRSFASSIELFDNPYATKNDRYTLDKDTGQVFPKGKPTRNLRLFPSKAFNKNKVIVNDFVEFSEHHYKSTWRYWNFAFPDRKVAVKDLKEDLRFFNKKIDLRIDELMKLGLFEPILIAIHVQYSKMTNDFHLHAHIICDVSDEDFEKVYQKLGRGFSNVNFPTDPLKSPGACARYMVDGVMDHRDILTWPEDAFRSIWDLSTSKAKLVRPRGSFRDWRAAEERKRRATPEAIERRAKTEKRRETAHGGRRELVGDRFLAMIPDYTPQGIKLRPLFETSADLSQRLEEQPARTRLTRINKDIKSTAMDTTTPEPIRGELECERHWWWRVWPYGRGGASRRFALPIRRRLARRASSVRAAPGTAKFLTARQKLCDGPFEGALRGGTKKMTY